MCALTRFRLVYNKLFIIRLSIEWDFLHAMLTNPQVRFYSDYRLYFTEINPRLDYITTRI